MEKRNDFLTFITALIPGVGYMYLGLIKKGVQILALFLLIEPVLRLLGIGFLSFIVRLPIWFYTFFDTFRVARKMDRGEIVEDSEFIYKKYENGTVSAQYDFNKMGKNLWVTIAWALIILGSIAILDKVFRPYEIYSLIKNYISNLLLPVILVLAGVYMLFKNKN